MVTQARPTTPAAHRFTRDEYAAMTATGVFDGKRVELLEGEIIDMAPKLTPHAYTVSQLTVMLARALDPARWTLRIQDPVILDDRSEPEPDVAVCDAVADKYLSSHPTPEHVHLLIEVAESSLGYDLGRKRAAYAGAGIARYWVVDLVDGQVHVFADPDPVARSYRTGSVVDAAGAVALPDGSTVATAAFLPPAP